MLKKGVLFVDDEPNILSAIKRMLRSIRHEFDLYFAESGAEALMLMEENSIDIVVSDMRMPGMDGAQLLAEVQQRFPQSIRIMLTGQAAEESILRTVNIVHQFLAKPCEPERLKEVLARSGALHQRVTNEHLKSVISGIETLPSIPSLYAKLQKVLNNPEAVLDDVVSIIEQDVAMTAKLLHMVNSSFFGLYKQVESPARAAKLLGLDTIKILVLGVQIFSEVKVQSPELSIEDLWKHSVAVAHCSKQIAMQATEDTEMINNCYVAGMLHDIGKLLLISNLQQEYASVIRSAQENSTTLNHEETITFRSTHGDVGAYLLGLWGFHVDVIEAIAYHNNLDAYLGTTFSPALAVHTANACYHNSFPKETIGAPPTLDRVFFSTHNLEDRLEEWVSIANESLASSAQ